LLITDKNNHTHCINSDILKSTTLGIHLHIPITYNNRNKLQFIILLTAIVLCFTHRKQQKW